MKYCTCGRYVLVLGGALQVSAGDGQEVSALLCPSRYILAAGWSRVVRVYSDLPGHDVDPAAAAGGDCAGCSEQVRT